MSRLRERGVLRVAASYALIAWLVLQIADVVLEPLGLPRWVMTALIIAAAVGFPIAIALAWFLEIAEHGVELDTAPDGMRRPSARGLRHYADAIVIGVLLIAVVVLAVRQSDIGKPKPPENPAIAVLPFDNLSGDPGQEYFSDGLAEEMLDRLSRVPGLRVIARSSSFGFKGKDLDARVIAGKLGVTTLLEGSVRREGDRLKLNARLIDGSSGQQVWSGSYDREMTDVFDVQAELAAAIVNAIIPAARGALDDHAPPPTTDLSAYDLYLLARSQLAVGITTTLEKSASLVEQALQADPDFALAHAHLATSLLMLRELYSPDLQQSATWLRKAESSVHRALALDPDLSEAHQAYARLLLHTEQPGAEDEYRRALELNPNNAAAWQEYADFLGQDPGRGPEADRARARSMQLDPRQPLVWEKYLPTVIEPGGDRYRAELDRGIRMIGDIPDGLTWIGLGTTFHGYPRETMKVALAKRALRATERAGAWLFAFRAWHPVDLDRAEAALAPPESIRGNEFLEQIRLTSMAEILGLRGDWADLDRVLEQHRALNGDADPGVAATTAFWLAVQERYSEAAAALELAEPLRSYINPPHLGGDTITGLMDTAKLRIYRATGRKAEADRYAAQLLAALRVERKAAGPGCSWDGWMRYASIAANEGLKGEAVDALRGAMRCSDLPFGFRPQLPWFRSLEGYAPYDGLVRERAARIDTIKAELERLEAGTATGNGSRHVADAAQPVASVENSGQK